MKGNKELNKNEHICNAKQGGLMVAALFLGMVLFQRIIYTCSHRKRSL